jgi:hypothetical protein
MKAEPALARLLQNAIDRGQVVVIPSLLPPLRSKIEAPLVATCCLLFGLTHAESRALVTLTRHAHVSREALHAAISRDGKPVSGIKIVDVIICSLRKKLKPHNIWITTLSKSGYALDRAARDRVYRQIAGHDAGLIPTITPITGKTETEPNAENE